MWTSGSKVVGIVRLSRSGDGCGQRDSTELKEPGQGPKRVMSRVRSLQSGRQEQGRSTTGASACDISEGHQDGGRLRLTCRHFYQRPLSSLIRKGLGHLHNRSVMHVTVPEV